MKKLGLVGYRGMVGSVLMQRMAEEHDLQKVTPFFFSTSQVGREGPVVEGKTTGALLDAYNLDALMEMDIIITCQGGDYTKAVYPQLKERGYKGFWIDAASSLRMEKDAVIILDPAVREEHIRHIAHPFDAFGSHEVASGTRDDARRVIKCCHIHI